MKKAGVIYLITFISIYACKKDDTEINSSDFIRIGSYDNMIKNSYDSIIMGEYNDEVSIDLDLNKDGTNDLRLSSEIWGSPGMGQHPEASVKCLHEDCLIKGLMKSDTTFYSYFVHTYYGENESPFYIQYYHTYSTKRINSDDSIVAIQTNRFKIDYLNEQDFLNKSDLYQSGDFILTETWSAWVDGPYPNLTNDTVCSIYETHYDYSNMIPSNKLSYIGIKLNNQNEEKIGWLKLGVMDDYKIILLETAVQR